MHSNLFTAKNVIVQGITGGHGSFHTSSMLVSGTQIVAGTSPGKAGQFIDSVPVYATISDIQKDFKVDTTIIFVPAPFAKNAMNEAIDAGVPLIICITEGIPVHDMIAVKKRAEQAGVTIIGPNCPGVLLPGVNKLGIIPTAMGLPGNVGIVSRSGTLTYEVAAGLSRRKIGQKYIIGIGGDRIQGTNFVDCLELFENDPDVHSVVLIGEIGGTGELIAADFIKEHISKPVYAYIAGHTAPKGVSLGHAGAILGSDNESTSAKTAALSNVGALTFASVTELIASVK